jgi:hypothetical protein
MPKKPGILSVRGFIAFECAPLLHFLDLASVGPTYGVVLHPRRWGDEIAKMVCKGATSQLKIGEINMIYISLRNLNKSM